MRLRGVAAIVVALVVIGWALVPAGRAILLVQRGAASRPIELPHADVVFFSEDGVRLHGSYVATANARGTVVLVHGFKNSLADMSEDAAFLHDAGYAVFLYDSRGCAASDGTFGVGATEYRDVIGAVSLLKSDSYANASHVAVLGVSLGAGDAILAAARDTRIDAVIADSAWPDESVQLDRMASLRVGPIAIPLLPYEPRLVDALAGARLEDARPRDVIARISPRPLLLIHSVDDENATTPLAGAQEMYASAGQPKELWLAPHGGHAGALGAQPQEYARRVLDFLDRAFR